MKKRYEWMFSDKEYQDGTFDIHFLLDTQEGEVKKIIQQRKIVTKKNEETLIQ